MKLGFSYEEHTADVKVKVIAPSFSHALVEAARACTNLLTAVESVEPKKTVEIHITGETREKLAFKFLEEIVFLLDTSHFVACSGELLFSRGKIISGTLHGDSISNYDHHGDITNVAITRESATAVWNGVTNVLKLP